MKNGPYELLVAPKGYPGKLYRGRYAYEHHVVFWKKNGFTPKTGYELHHINGDHRDNRISNLKLVTSLEHRKLHGLQNSQRALRIIYCGFCNKQLFLRQSVVTARLKQNKKSKKLFCSTSCGAKNQHKALGDASQGDMGRAVNAE